MKKLIILFFAINLIAFAQEINKTYFSLSPKGFINSWLLRGPFQNDDKKLRDDDYLKSSGGELNAYPMESILKDIGTDKKLQSQEKWYLVYSESYIINLLSYYTLTSKVAAYALCYVESEKEQTVKFKFGSDDGVKLFLNGKQLHDNGEQRGVVIDNDIVNAQLNKGMNTLLLKIDQGGGDWGFCLRILGENDEQLKNIKIAMPGSYSNDELLKTALSSFNINTILTKGYDPNSEKANKFSQSEFFVVITSEIGIPMNVDQPVKLKLVMLNNSNQVVEEFYKKEVPSISNFTEDKVIFSPKNLEPGQYIIRLIVLDKNDSEILNKENVVFWN
jgi:hypothetical protein